MDTPKPRHYIIVVHGIGEQKLNETTLDVVHRFAEVRQNKEAGFYQYLLPSHLSAQSVRHRPESEEHVGHGWSEFNGIPIEPEAYALTGTPSPPFDGTPATDTAGQNFRFVDLHWAHILQRHQNAFASPVERWTEALVARIDARKGNVPPDWMPAWATSMLHALKDTVLPIQQLLAYKYPDLARLIFTDFLGDVHLYGDYARTRGHAVRHFHVILDEIHLRDFIDWCRYHKGGIHTYCPPVYTVIAHSLGSIMSFDALTYAYANTTVRQEGASAGHACPSLPFVGYTDAAPGEQQTWINLLQRLKEIDVTDSDGTSGYALLSQYRELAQHHTETNGWPGIPPLLWRDGVKHFITLGAPIDKYHVIWFQNYLHMGLKRKSRTPKKHHEVGHQRDDEVELFPEHRSTWVESWLEEPQHKIVHYNLCDEQDPVGHHLDVTQATTNYGKIFNTSIPVVYRDVVFRRYAVPGAAHMKYWEDGHLFTGIIKEVMEEGKYFTAKELTLVEQMKGELSQPGAAAPEESPSTLEEEGLLQLQRGFFLTAAFRDKDETVYTQALLWAYFRIPFAVAMATGLLLLYSLHGLLSGGLNAFSLTRFFALVAVVLLWTRPLPLQEYGEEAQPDATASVRKRWRFRRSVFAHLVAGAVEWRRVLLLLNEAGGATHLLQCLRENTRMTFTTEGQFMKRFWPRFAMGLAFVTVSWILLRFSQEWPVWLSHIGEGLLFLAASYLGTMTYVGYVFHKAKRTGCDFCTKETTATCAVCDTMAERRGFLWLCLIGVLTTAWWLVVLRRF